MLALRRETMSRNLAGTHLARRQTVLQRYGPTATAPISLDDRSCRPEPLARTFVLELFFGMPGEPSV